MTLPQRVIADDLWFPEGPLCLPDGSLLLVEIRRQTLTHIATDGSKRIVANLGGGPNGAALGPDGWVYVCNNGGFAFAPRSEPGVLLPAGMPADYVSGRIDRVHPQTGEHQVLYRRIGDHVLRGPNDLVFDRQGGFWFTDLGKSRARDMDFGGLYYARADGSEIREVVYPLMTPNGVALSPDGRTLYAAETSTARIWAWDVTGPGRLALKPGQRSGGGRLLYASPKSVRFDSMAVEAGGNLCVATLDEGAISVLSPQGALLEEHHFADAHVTNICFGGAGLRTAYVTLSGRGQLVACDWPRPGLALNGG